MLLRMKRRLEMLSQDNTINTYNVTDILDLCNRDKEDYGIERD